MASYRAVFLALVVVLVLNGKSRSCFCSCCFRCFVFALFCFFQQELDIFKVCSAHCWWSRAKTHPLLQLWRMRQLLFLGLVPAWAECVERFASPLNSSLDLWAVEKGSCKSGYFDMWIYCVYDVIYMIMLLFVLGAAYLIFYKRLMPSQRSVNLFDPREKTCWHLAEGKGCFEDLFVFGCLVIWSNLNDKSLGVWMWWNETNDIKLYFLICFLSLPHVCN